MPRNRRLLCGIGLGTAILGAAAALIAIFAHRRDWMAEELEIAGKDVPLASKI